MERTRLMFFRFSKTKKENQLHRNLYDEDPESIKNKRIEGLECSAFCELLHEGLSNIHLKKEISIVYKFFLIIKQMRKAQKLVIKRHNKECIVSQCYSS